MCSYLPEEHAFTSHLRQVGIHALCVGNCDSERLTTHGFFWTNHANRRETTSAATTATRRATRRATTQRRRWTMKRTTTSSKTGSKSSIFGKGVVFYLDRTGRIRGIMTWGLPFTSSSSEDDNHNSPKQLNRDLVNRMKSIIETNGNNLLSQADEEDTLLEPHHLDEETRNLASLAFVADDCDGESRLRSRPLLHRYQPAKPANIASLGKLRRGKDHAEGDELLGENIYVKNQETSSAQQHHQRPPSLIYIYPLHHPQQQDSLPTDPYRLTEEERKEEAWTENERRARPPKEELLWLRRNEANRFINHKLAQTELWFNTLMRPGVFADGSDPITRMQAPSWRKKRDDTTTKKDEEGEKKEKGSAAAS
uniref:Uncharacterized protein n=1 Tax=Grammatophora oceanica TaxID=210454 RepID=A0A7S1VJP0_9STRA